MRACQNGGRKMKKIVSILLSCFVFLFPMQSYASGWQGNAEKGWWYGTNAENSTWYQDGWHWIDGNHDGIAECYYFTNDGYLVVKGETPDGFLVNDSGAWMVNNSVQTKMVETGENGTAQKQGQVQKNTETHTSKESTTANPTEYSYIGNKNTHKFHRPSCRSIKQMKESNKVAIVSREDAIRKGYIPCAICNP